MEIADALPPIEEPAWEQLENNDDFGRAAFELLKAASGYAYVAAALLPTEGYDRNDAILCGLILKAGKLGKAMVAMSAHLGSDRQIALVREIVENVATLSYLAGDVDGSRFERYIQDSLIAEREFLRLIESNRRARGETWPIEESMSRSIERTARDAGVHDVMTLPSRRSVGWPSAESLLENLGANLYPAYRNGSSVLHTQWLDLIRHHIRKQDDGSFGMRLGDDPVRPEPLYAVGILLVDATRDYLARAKPAALPRFADGLREIEDYLVELVRRHGELLDGPGPDD